MIIPDLSDKNASQVVHWTEATFGTEWVMASSFSIEDNVLLDLVVAAGIKPKVFFLDTGRLHEETYAAVDKIRSRYDFDLKIYHPDPQDLTALLEHDSYTSIFDSKMQRRACCRVRKVIPLRKALSEAKA